MQATPSCAGTWCAPARSCRRLPSGLRRSCQVKVPARVLPLPVTMDEYLGKTAPHRALHAPGVNHRFVAPIEHDDVAKPLRARFEKRQTDKAPSSFGLHYARRRA
jgi:hypothetical protein